MKQRYKLFDTEKEAMERIPDFGKILVMADEHKVCIVRENSTFYAFNDSCPHLGASFYRGQFTKFSEIVCPWHSYRFSVRSGNESTGKDCSLTKYEVEVSSKGFFIII